LNKRTIIRKGIAFFLLLLFLTGSLPKAYFHDLVADHVDKVSCDQKHTSAVLHKQSINCHFDDLVVTSPFVTPVVSEFEAAVLHFEKEQFTRFNSYQYSFVQHTDSRGPPVVSYA